MDFERMRYREAEKLQCRALERLDNDVRDALKKAQMRKMPKSPFSNVIYRIFDDWNESKNVSFEFQLVRLRFWRFF